MCEKNLRDTFKIKEQKINTIYNAVQIEKVDAKNYSQILNELKGQKYRLVGIVGRLSEQKGADVFIHAIARVCQEMPDVKGVIIGAGEDEKVLKELTGELGIEENIVFLGYQEHITTLIKQLDLVVMPSRWEGFPLTPIEVFAVQKTIVASNIEGINEIVKNENNGILVKKDDISAFSEAIKKLIQESNMRSSLEKNGYQYYENHFNYAGFIKSYQELYEKIVSKV